jgi:RNA polymerase sigma-70 factor (ECF subfamily)
MLADEAEDDGAVAASVFAQWLVRARAGDAAAFERVLARTASRLRGFVDARLGRRLRASLRHSDVLQNTYLQMVDALPSFDGKDEDQFVAWAAKIIEHDIHRQHRWFGAKKRRPPSTSERNALARILTDPPPTPSAEFCAAERSASVRRALGRLEPDHSEVIQLALIEGLPHKDVAARLGRSEGACRMLLLRARAALALELERAGHPSSADEPR